MKNPLDKIVVTQEFGANPEYYNTIGLKGHEGVDFKTRNLGVTSFWNELMGWQTAKAIESGICEGFYGHRYYGTYVELTAKDRIWRYCHLKNVRPPSPDSVIPGPRLIFNVKEGDSVGITGNSGNSSGPHLHLMYKPRYNADTNNGYFGFEDPMKQLLGGINYKFIYLSDTDDIHDAVGYCNDKFKQFTGGLMGVEYVFKPINPIHASPNHDLDQFIAMAVVDSQTTNESRHGFVLGHYGSNSSMGFSTYTSPKNRIMTQGYKPYPADTLLFELKHQAILFYNINRGSNPFIPLIDNYSGGLEIVKQQLESLKPYISLFRL